MTNIRQTIALMRKGCGCKTDCQKGRLKNGEAGGKTGILPELLLFGGEVMCDRLLQIMKSVWQAGAIPRDWKDAVVVPIPKKGDLKDCDNWRGISLLDVVGKVFARVIQERLQQLAEEILPDSECGFWRGRGCTDMIYAARQLVEKCREHDDCLFLASSVSRVRIPPEQRFFSLRIKKSCLG